MSKKRLRLNQVAREFNVGLSTITELLEKRGVSITGAPGAIIEPEVYAIIEKEFGGGDMTDKRASVRERINFKAETVTLDDMKEVEQKKEPEQEVLVKSNVISVKDEAALEGPKIVGKMDLDAKKKPVQKAKPVEEVIEKKETPKVEAKVEPKIEPKPESKVESKVESKIEPKVERKVEPKVAAKGEKSFQPRREERKPEVSKEQRTKTFDERAAADDSNLFRTEVSAPAGPVVLGKIDVKVLDNASQKRGKRKRITKDKVDVSKTKGSAKPTSRDPKKTKPDIIKGKGKKRVVGKPIKNEVDDDAVQRQVRETLAKLTGKGGKSSRSARYRRDKREQAAARVDEETRRSEGEESVLKVTEFVTVSELASMMDVAVTEVITVCMNLGLMVSINQRLDAEALTIVAEEFGYTVEFVSVEIQEAIDTEEDATEDLIKRPPIVTVMGHVDHGKTSLLDNIRKANVTAGEAGGITQHIGAYSVKINDERITFLDTPGHEAFTAMRARGAQITDVAIIIVAADDSVMPQTEEAINHASAAGVPIVFAINKIDKQSANPEKIKEQLATLNYLVEDWGGKYQSQDISAKQGLNLDKLLEKVLLEAELLDNKANPNRKASGVVIESSLDKGRGYMTTLLVQNGTMHVGDVLLAGTYSGRVKAMFNENGAQIDNAPPSMPVLVLGFNGAPQAGDVFNVMDDDKSARDIANKREQLQRMQGLRTQKHVTLDEIGRRIAIGNFKELNVIIKGDVDGSIEAMADSLQQLSHEEVQLNVIHKAVGQISESDVLLAAASNAIVVGFQVRPSADARKLAESEEIEIRLYSVIYDAINDIKDAIKGMLAPLTKEEIVASVEVLQIFKISRVGTIAGCIVREGRMTRNTPIRVIRDGIVIYTGKLASLKRERDDAKEVTRGMECGMSIESFNDLQEGDFVEGYDIVEVKR